MLTTIKGIYDHGQIILTEQPPLKTKADVIVTFLSEEESKALPLKKRLFGGLEGKLKLPDDFNEPLDEMKDYM
jgi:Protein of unknown function (DUF2281)